MKTHSYTHARHGHRSRVSRRATARFELLEQRWLLVGDVFEPNDSFGAAVFLETGDVTVAGLSIHESGNDDWYVWTSPADGNLNINVDFQHSAGDIDIALHDAGGGLLALSNTTTDNEHVFRLAGAGGVYFVHVYGYSGATNPSYTLEIDGPGGIPSDFCEPNDELGQAFNLGTGDQGYGGLTVHRAPGQEFQSSDDWYLWTALSAVGGTLRVDIDFRHALGDLDLKLYDLSGTEVASSTSFENHESVTWGVSAGESVYVHVYGFNGVTNPRYTLSIDGPDIARDRFEPNDSLEERTYVGTRDTSQGGLSIHYRDNDFYLWTAPSTGTLDVDVLFTHAQGDVDLELLDSFGQYVTQSNSTDDDEHVSIPVRGGDQYYIRVYGKSLLEATLNYTLAIDGPDVSDLAGDTDSDGDVNLNDLNAVRNHFGEGVIGGPHIPGDAYPFDGTVNLEDLNAVRNHFGESLGAPTSAPVVSVESHGDRYRNSPPSQAFDVLFRLMGENEAFGVVSPKRAAVRRR